MYICYIRLLDESGRLSSGLLGNFTRKAFVEDTADLRQRPVRCAYTTARLTLLQVSVTSPKDNVCVSEPKGSLHLVRYQLA